VLDASQVKVRCPSRYSLAREGAATAMPRIAIRTPILDGAMAMAKGHKR